MPSLYKSCDAGVDQLLYGWYGNVSLELMASGVPVVCYIDEELRKHRHHIPVVSATPASLKDALVHLMKDSNLRGRLSMEGVEYVKSHHSPEAVCDRLVAAYDESPA
jgi:glycosyltransferase involved in cell wall biosynthesis